jgi:hypothetical protein
MSIPVDSRITRGRCGIDVAVERERKNPSSGRAYG